MTKTDLENAVRSAHDVIQGIRRLRDLEIAKETSRICDKYADSFREAGESLRLAQDRLDAYNVEHAADNSKYPIGTILHKWDLTGSTWDINRKWKITGRKGVVEVFKPGDSVSDNKSSYSRPKYGEIVVRTFNRDGKLGKDCDSWNHKHDNYWLPEGQTPGTGGPL